MKGFTSTSFNQYIDSYEKNLIKNATKETALRLKKEGVDSDIVYECNGVEL